MKGCNCSQTNKLFLFYLLFLFCSTSLTLHPSFLFLCYPIFSFSVSHPLFFPVSVTYSTQVCRTTWASWQPQGSVSHSGYDGPWLCPHCQDFTLLHGICPGWEVSLILVRFFFNRFFLFCPSRICKGRLVLSFHTLIWSTQTHATSINLSLLLWVTLTYKISKYLKQNWILFWSLLTFIVSQMRTPNGFLARSPNLLQNWKETLHSHFVIVGCVVFQLGLQDHWHISLVFRATFITTSLWLWYEGSEGCPAGCKQFASSPAKFTRITDCTEGHTRCQPA